MSQIGRLFLVDHMCVLPFGHNLNALVLFEDALKEHFTASLCLATRDLPSYAEQSVRVQRVLYYPYGGFVPVVREKPKNSRKKTSSSRDYSSILGKFLRRNLYIKLYELTGYDLARHRTRGDWKKIFKQFEIGAHDAIFFPSAEYYGCISLLDVLRELPETHRPKVHFRLIGVSENARYSRGAARPEFFKSIREAVAAGVRVTVSAETTTYATYVERLLGTPVTYLPYPLANSQQPINWSEVKIVASPGQGRGDKGFFRLFSIISRLERLAPKAAFRFDIQNMRESDEEYRGRYVSILKNLPNIDLRPARLRQDEIDAVYAGADILLMPYDPETYALRGSAVYQEGLAIGRPVVSSMGMGQSDLVLRYGNGLLAMSDDDFAAKIVELAGRSKQDIEQATTMARRSYQHDFQSGLQKIVKDLTQ